MVACNQQLLAMFGARHDNEFAGRSFELLYPTHEEFERTGERIVASLEKAVDGMNTTTAGTLRHP